MEEASKEVFETGGGIESVTNKCKLVSNENTKSRQPPYIQWTNCLPTTVRMLEPPKRGQPPNNVQNTRPQRVHCLEVPMYITMKRCCYFTPVIAVENHYLKDFGFTVVNALTSCQSPRPWSLHCVYTGVLDIFDVMGSYYVMYVCTYQ